MYARARVCTSVKNTRKKIFEKSCGNIWRVGYKLVTLHPDKPINLKHMKYTTKIGVYCANTSILIDIYTLSDTARCKQINDNRAMSNAKKAYRDRRLADLANQYGDVIYKLVADGLIDPLDIYTFDIL